MNKVKHNHQPSDARFRYRYIHVCRDAQLDTWEGKPIWYIFNNRTSEALGRILWYKPWKRWIAQFDESSIWSTDCLVCVSDALDRLARQEKDPH